MRVIPEIASTPTRQLAAIRDALEAAGVPDLPPGLQAAQDLAHAVKTMVEQNKPDQVAGRLVTHVANEDATAESFGEVVEATVPDYARALLVDHAMRLGVTARALDMALRRAIIAARDELVELVRPGFNRARDELVKAAAKLPEGDAALDVDAVVQADVGAAYMKAREAVRRLVTIAHGALPHVEPVQYEHRREPVNWLLRLLVGIVDLPDIPIKYTVGLSYYVVNQDQMPVREPYERLVRAVRADLSGRALEQALVDVARGAYDGARIELATPAQLDHRARQATNAITTIHADNDVEARAKMAGSRVW